MAYYGSLGNFGGGGANYGGSFNAPTNRLGYNSQPNMGYSGSSFGNFGGASYGSGNFGAPAATYGSFNAQPQIPSLGYSGSSIGSFGGFNAQPQFPQQIQPQGFNSRFGAPAAQQFGAAPYYGQAQFGQPQQQLGAGFGQGFNNSYGFVGQQSGATVTAAGPAGFGGYNAFGAGPSQFGAQPFGQPEFGGMPENTQKNSLDLSQYVRSTAAVAPAGNDDSPVSAALDSLKGDIEAARKAAETSPKV